jgi:hypothetical protein
MAQQRRKKNQKIERKITKLTDKSDLVKHNPYENPNAVRVTSQQQPTKAMKASSAAANKGQQTPYV